MGRGYVLGLALFALVLASFLTVIYIQSTPQYSLYQVYQAVKNRDYEKFSTYVDVDALTTNETNRYIKFADTELQKKVGNNPLGQFGLKVGRRLVISMRPDIDKVIQGWIRDEVISGDMMDSTFQDVNPLAFTKVKVTRVADIADISLPIEKKPLHVKMKHVQNNYWQVFDIEIDPAVIRNSLQLQ